MEASILIKKIRESRLQWVKSGEFEFQVRRPTEMELAEQKNRLSFVRTHVQDWRGFTEGHLLGNGSDSVLPFDLSLWVEWIDDQPMHWMPIIDAILEAQRQHEQKITSTEKN